MTDEDTAGANAADECEGTAGVSTPGEDEGTTGANAAGEDEGATGANAAGADEDPSFRERLAAAPRPAALWALGAVLVVLPELGALVETLVVLGSQVPAVLATALAGAEWVRDLSLGAFGPAGWAVALALWAFALAVVVEVLRLAVPTRALLRRFAPDVAEGAEHRTLVRYERAVLAVAVAAAVLLAYTPALGLVDGAIGVFVSALSPLRELPTLLSREVIPNQGHRLPGGGWEGTFLGLPPAFAWALRVALIYLYAAVCVWWGLRGYRVYRRHYRVSSWTPTDDTLGALRVHRWGNFGFLVVFLFVTMAVFAPALGPTTVQENIERPYSYSIQYLNEETGGIEEITVGRANGESRSRGLPDTNVGPLTYDDFGRFHPFGTLPNGKDLFTFIVAGARISLVIGLLSAGASAAIAVVVALATAYYKGVLDLAMVVIGDTIMGVPRLLILVLLTVLLGDTWLSEIYSGGVLLALILAGTGWPYLWRTVRGPALQVAEEEWIDAARSFGAAPARIMRKHMAPYIVGYLLVYFSMVLGGVILAVAGLTFLGLGITAPTPEWGRAVNLGQDYVASPSWHISLIPGILITLIVMGFNAVGDAVRDAIDPEAEGGTESGVEGRGGGA